MPLHAILRNSRGPCEMQMITNAFGWEVCGELLGWNGPQMALHFGFASLGPKYTRRKSLNVGFCSRSTGDENAYNWNGIKIDVSSCPQTHKHRRDCSAVAAGLASLRKIQVDSRPTNTCFGVGIGLYGILIPRITSTARVALMMVFCWQ